MPLMMSLMGVGVLAFIACSTNPPPIVPVSSSYYGDYSAPTGAFASRSSPGTGNWADPYAAYRYYGYRGEQSAPSSTPAPSSSSRKSPSTLYREVAVKRDFLSYRARGRTRRSMNPTYITIHSTQNWSKGADANRHSLALKRGALGRLSWHYTVDQYRAVQHLPTSEQGNHADYDGPGNKYSIGIEMCENPGNSRSATVERTAKLSAWLMYKHNIPISRVVPHYRWPRYGKRPANKNCPHFLLDGGRPGRKWQAYLEKVKRYHRQIVSSPSQYASL